MKKTPPESAGPQREHRLSSLLWTTYQIARKYQFKRLVERGFDDLNPPLLNIMIYPHPDGVRPSDLVEKTNMTKQAVNHLLGQLEKLGYLERRPEKRGGRRLVYVTKRGWQAIYAHRAAVQEVEKKWSALVGEKRFAQFMEVLRALSGKPLMS
jgi:DNA-binding MarR family transcriptional regulator